jgi:peptide/nickel transport system permease protein
MFVTVIATAGLAPVLAPYDPTELNVGPQFQGPGPRHLFGTDNYGRDLFSRVVYGSRISLLVATGVVACSAGIGVPLGLIAGYRRGLLDYLLMRLVDIAFSFRSILIALTAAAIIGPGLDTVLIALVIVYSPILARLTRSVVLSIREEEYVEAARALGETDLSIMFRYILPNALSPIIVQCTSLMGFAILAEAGISYLGLGTRPPTPSWGLGLSEGSRYMGVAPYLVIFPGVAIAYTVLAFNFLGDGLRDIFDPRYQA